MYKIIRPLKACRGVCSTNHELTLEQAKYLANKPLYLVLFIDKHGKITKV